MSFVFFTDRDLGLRFPQILRDAGLTVERHADHFPHDCADDVWLAKSATEGWVALTHDSRIRYKPNELAAVVAHRVRLLVIVGKAPYPDLARSFVASLGPVLDFLHAHSPPMIGKVYRPSAAELSTNPATPGRVALWYPTRAEG